MIARHKLQRELERLQSQLNGLRWRFIGGLQRRSYDRKREKLVVYTPGSLPAQEEAAVFLIYQPKGLLASTVLTLKWLASRGVAPVVVSNTPLTDQDRDTLRPLTHLIIERPNIGYDFGGYREGVLTVLQRLPVLRAIHVMNDSMWFPIRTTCDVIEDGRQTKADLFGLFLSRFSNREGKEYLQSYYYRFGSRVLSDPEFLAFWRDMPLICNKFMVVRRHERKLTEYFCRRGFSTDAVTRWERVIAYILALDDSRLTYYLDFQRAISQIEKDRMDAVGFSGENLAHARPAVEELIRKRRLFVNLAELHPALLGELGVCFLKKGRSTPLLMQRQAIRHLGLGKSMAPEVASEITLWDDQPAMPSATLTTAMPTRA